MKSAPQLDLVPVTFEITEQVLQELNVDNSDYPDFVRCVEILKLQIKGHTFKDACATAGVNVRTTYETRWLELQAKARKLLARPLLENVAAQSNLVYDEWGNIIKSLVNVAKTANFDRDKVAAAELLYQIYIQPIQEAPKDDVAESNYFKKPKNFNPLTPIQVNDGGTVIINQGKEDA